MNNVTGAEARPEIEKLVSDAAKYPPPSFKEMFGDKVPTADDFPEATADKIRLTMAN